MELYRLSSSSAEEFFELLLDHFYDFNSAYGTVWYKALKSLCLGIEWCIQQTA